jgi:hypothetical protein
LTKRLAQAQNNRAESVADRPWKQDWLTEPRRARSESVKGNLKKEQWLGWLSREMMP